MKTKYTLKMYTSYYQGLVMELYRVDTNRIVMAKVPVISALMPGGEGNEIDYNDFTLLLKQMKRRLANEKRGSNDSTDNTPSV